MDKVTLVELKKKIENWLAQVEDLIDDHGDAAQVVTHSNTYFCKSNEFAALGRAGFVDLGKIKIEGADNKDDE